MFDFQHIIKKYYIMLKLVVTFALRDSAKKYLEPLKHEFIILSAF